MTISGGYSTTAPRRGVSDDPDRVGRPPFADGPDEDPSFASLLADTIMRWRIAAWTLVAAWGIAIVAMVALPPAWRAAASFSPNLSSASKIPSSLGSMAGGAGSLGAIASGLSSGSDPSETPYFYRELLSSRELLTRLLLSKFPNYRSGLAGDSATFLDLRNRWTRDRKRALEKEIKELRSDLAIGADQRANLVGLSIDTEWPELSADVVNRAVQLVNEFNIQQRQTRGRVKRIFLAARVDSTKNDLDKASRVLRDFNADNRDWKTSPVLSARQQELKRQQEIAEELYLATRRDYEAARVNEINDAALITVIDSAVAPRKKQFPRIGITLGIATAAGILLGVLFAAIGAIGADWRRRDPSNAARLTGALGRARAEISDAARGLGRSRRA